jgi:hypothetical protein
MAGHRFAQIYPDANCKIKTPKFMFIYFQYIEDFPFALLLWRMIVNMEYKTC